MLALGRSLSDKFDIIVAAIGEAGGHVFLKQAAKAGLRIKAIDFEEMPRFGIWLHSVGAVLLHVHAGIGWEGHELVRAGKAEGLPIVRTEHLPYLLTSVVQQAAYRAMLLSVDRVIAVSGAVRDSFAEAHGPHRFDLVPNGIFPPVARVERSATRAKLGILAHEQMLLTVARFTPQKGYPTLLAALPAVLQIHPHARFIWVGEGPEFAAMSEAVRLAGLDHAVKFMGQRDDVADLLMAADALVLPSLFEGLPLVLLEAMSVGLPIVATAIGGTIEALGADHPLLAPPNDPAGLGAAIIKVLADIEAAGSIGVAGKARFESHFQAHRMAAQTVEIYAELLAPSSPNLKVHSA